MTTNRNRMVVGLALVALGLAACGQDDGAEVRNIGGDGASISGTHTGSASASGTHTGSASGSGTHTGSASGTKTGSASGTHTGSGSATEAAAGCEPVGDQQAADTSVGVALDEWSIRSTPTEVGTGTVAFDTSNVGEEPHEFVVIRTDTPAGELPTDADGAVDENAIDGEVIGEIEPYPAGEDCAGTFDLEPGNYAFVCNIVEREDGEVEAHYQLGMRADFTVTG